MTNNQWPAVPADFAVSATALTLVFAAEAAAAQPAPPSRRRGPQTTVNSDEIVITGTRRTDRTVDQFGLAGRRHRLAGADAAADREPARHGQEHRPVLLCRQNTISDASSSFARLAARAAGDETLVQINGKRFNRSALVQVYAGGDTGL